MLSLNNQKAKILASFGVKVFPCNQNKTPMIAGGFLKASSDLAIVEQWGKQFPNAIYGLPCKENNILVLDADRHGKDDGVKAVTELFIANGVDWQSLPFVKTPRDGLHFYFKAGNSNDNAIKGELLPSIDIKFNGYVIAPFMRLDNGAIYQANEGVSIEQIGSTIKNGILPEIPEFLTQRILKSNLENDKFKFEVSSNQKSNRPSKITSEKQILEVVLKVCNAQEGERNKTLYWAATIFNDWVCNGQIRLDCAYKALNLIQPHISIPKEEFEKTVKSGLRG